MAQQYVTDAGTLIIPGAVADIKVEASNSGLATNGVLMLVGEADAGPSFDQETRLQDNGYSPDQFAAVVAKYGGGPLVDAFKGAIAPANDPNITGSFARAILVKTNKGSRAQALLKDSAGGDYAQIRDRNYGRAGNLIFYRVESLTPEVVPTTGAFTWTPPTDSFDFEVILNGVSLGRETVTAGDNANDFAAALTGLGLVATVDGNSITVSAPAGSTDGIGKSLEIAELTTKAGLLSSSVSPATWVSKADAPKVLTSASEPRIRLNVARNRDNIQEELDAGGEVALRIGYRGDTATVTITGTKLITEVTGGSGEALDLDLSDFPTIQDLATYINSRPGYRASVGTAVLGQLPAKALDRVTAGIATVHGAQAGRIKIDAYRFGQKVEESFLVQLSDQAGAGLPAVSTVSYLSGGARGGTTNEDVSKALLALERVRGNFLVPLFSRDAAADIADGLTDSGSTYSIEAINAATRAHVLAMSTLKRRRNRQGFLSVQADFPTAKEAASNTAAGRCAMSFMDIRDVDAAGSVKQFAPWMAGVKAAAMQAAGFYRPIVRKYANITGALAEGFDDQDDGQVEEALLAGLLPLRRAESGGWYWVSDQTTYGKDSNFVFNSIQATYVADVIAMTTAERMEQAFAGQSVADVSAALALAYLETIMDDFRRLKLIAPSDDAPRGFRNATIKISGPAMIVSVEVKLAGAIYFIPISFLVSQVQQSA